MKHYIGWQRFIQLLNHQDQRSDLSLAQREALEYMQAYASYNRKVLARVPKLMLDNYIETFLAVPKTDTKEEKKK